MSMEVLALASYPIQAAATRYRLHQFVEPLSQRGITLNIRPFLDSKLFKSLYDRSALPRTAFGLVRAGLLRSRDVLAARRADVILIQREAALFGPPVVEWFSSRLIKRPLVLDLDDATYVPYTGLTYGRLVKPFKWFSKTDDLIRWAKIVTCGNRTIAEYVTSKGTEARIIPTVVDSDIFRPVPPKPESETLVIGWVGTHSTFPYLQSIFPVLSELGQKYKFRLKIVGAGKNDVAIPGVEVENLTWDLHREVKDFQSIDIGLYPIDPGVYGDKWTAGKSGFKAIQYMNVGIPYVATPVGTITEIGEPGSTHFCVRTLSEWRDALSLLVSDRERRLRMGQAGRQYVTEHFGLAAQADKLADTLHAAVR